MDNWKECQWSTGTMELVNDALAGLTTIKALGEETLSQVKTLQAPFATVYNAGNSIDESFRQKVVTLLLLIETKLTGIIDNKVTSEAMADLHMALRATGRRLIGDKWEFADIWVLAMNETHMWQLPEEIISKLECIEAVYIFDMNYVANISGLDGSYWLAGLYQRPIFKADIPECDRMPITELIEHGELTDNYYNVKDIAVIMEKLDKTSGIYHMGNPAVGLDFLTFKKHEPTHDSHRMDKILTIVGNYCKKQVFVTLDGI
jgi:hypothetical protein